MTTDCCAICLDPHTDDDTTCHTLACGHRFHTSCIVRCLRTSSACPVCRDDPHAATASGDETEEDDDVTVDMDEIHALRRSHRNYLNRQNRLARENADVGRLRTDVRHTREAYTRQLKHLNRTLHDLERRMSQNPDVVAARKMHRNARRRYVRARNRFNQVAEGLLGPPPPSVHILEIA